MLAKMIITDLDGTLLKDDKTVSDYTVSVFKRCRDNGIKIVFATARPVRTVKNMNIGIESDAAIYHNGAVVTVNGEVFLRNAIESEIARDLLSKAVKKFDGMRISAEINDVLYANFDTEAIWAFEQAVITDFKDFNGLPDLPAEKIIFDTVDGGLIREIEKLLPDGLYTEISENKLLMVMNKAANKFNAAVKVAGYFNISAADITAFGDDYNDIEMLKGCGTGVAMSNAIDGAKAAADFICGSNENDGVARWIEERILHERIHNNRRNT